MVLDYVTRRFNASSAGLNERSRGAEPSLEPPLSAISRSNWIPESAEVRALFKAPREDGFWFHAELDCG
jgi:hypothetical protein